MLWIISLLLNSLHSGKSSPLKHPELLFLLGIWNSKVLGLSGDALCRHSEKWGPSARTCVQIERNSMVADLLLARRVREAATSFVQTFGNRDELYITDVSHTLLSIRPKGLDVSQRVAMVTEVSTGYLNQIIAEATAAAVDSRQMEFYGEISRRPSFNPLAGYIFKTFFCAWFLGRRKSPTLYCLPLSHARSGPSLHAIPVCSEAHRISDMVSLKEAGRLNPPFGWWLDSPSFTTVNAIACTDNHIITIQVMVTPTCCVDLAVLDEMKGHFPPTFLARRKWCHIFVTDNEYNVATLRSNEYSDLTERSISSHSAVVDISELRLFVEDIRQVGETRVGSQCMCV
jgi:hypothetical protein